MNYRLLGPSGLRVSEFSLGTMTFGDDWGWGAAKDESRKIYDAYREAGGNFIDTAHIGARKLSQCEDNLASLSLNLTPEQVRTLDAASQIELGFPHDFYRRDMIRSFVYGGTRDKILA